MASENNRNYNRSEIVGKSSGNNTNDMLGHFWIIFVRCLGDANLLIRSLEKQKQKIIIPTPVLSEILVYADKVGPDYLNILEKSACFKIVSFDQRAAVELAAITREALDAKDKKNGSASPWAKVKFDRQIVANAKFERATTIYSDDKDIAKFAKKINLNVIRVYELSLPPEDSQSSIHFDDP